MVGRLVLAARHGNGDARDQLLRDAERLARSVILRAGVPACDEPDATQEVLIRVARMISVLRTPDAFPGWVKTAAQREAYRVFERRRDEVEWEHAAHDIPSDEADDFCNAEAFRDLYAAAIAEAALLPGRDAAVALGLLRLPEVTYAELSRELQMPVGSIGPIRARAFRRLRARLTAAGSAGLR